MYISPEYGGLGLIKIPDYINSIQSVWVKRANLSTRDNWRGELYKLSQGNPLTLSPGGINQLSNPILYNISVSFSRLTGSFSAWGLNFTEALILNNPIFTQDIRSSNCLDLKFFKGCNYSTTHLH